MKRALAVCTVLAVLGFSAFGIGTFSGKWVVGLSLIPGPSLSTNSLTLNYEDFGWTFGISLNTVTGSVTTSASGTFGLVDVKASSAFDLTSATYKRSELTAKLMFAGINVTMNARHWLAGNWYSGWGDEPCSPQTAGMQFIFDTKVDPFGVKLTFTDCCTGIYFDNAVLTLKGLNLCCGIALDVEYAFSKLEGFEHLQFTGINIPLCCGVSLDVGITFETKAKSVSITPKFAGLGEGCFTVYGEPYFEGMYWRGINIYGWKIACTLGDCSNATFATGIVTEFTGDLCYNSSDNKYIIIPHGATPPSGYDVVAEDVTYYGVSPEIGLGFQPLYFYYNEESETWYAVAEYETFQLTLCGVGCCGQKWTGAIKVFWADYYELDTTQYTLTEVDLTLFGLHRLAFDISIPIMDAFSTNASFSYNLFTGESTLTVGWTFTF
jgi:hypothetical protein